MSSLASKGAGDRRAFTLIELLTVIAIIAILAALLFPVFSRAGEQVRQTTCMSNLHQIYVAANLYKDDQGGYPTLLLGYAERPDGLPWVPADSAAPVPLNMLQHSPLTPYMKDKNTEFYHCPNNQIKSLTATTTAVFPANSPWSTVLPSGIPTV